MSKQMCGLWHENVAISVHNDNGACPCLNDCFGVSCCTCSTYKKYQSEIATEMMDAYEQYRESCDSRCTLCRRMGKTK